MTNVRGKYKTPGEFRSSQNWIGGSSLADAAFIPPHRDDLNALLDDFEHFLHNENIVIPHLVRCAITHYQFETIHPFQDGNGRIGRLLITLYLISNHLLIKPTLYLSDFFERHRGAYYDALSRVRESNDLGGWVRFFLEAVIETAEKGKTTFHNILKLHINIDNELTKLGKRTDNARKLLMHLYQSPVVNVKQVESILGIKYYSANELIKALVDLNILQETTGFTRNRFFLFKKYIDVFKG